ncbi:hypothetical protein A3A75_06210 [Candidatus Woesebacteria bacterium RIFCSPLOWO2_01_FULL_39_10]|uniref:Uncharacterized protein n=1 Tax=Candidatus Woesebacteria bacterium RIFCSPLOWO2_01_FULL_39_10 TaxID=1802516 RepID=A0A1F8B496_9BACT|nr:MAG: hypothetical protein A3A75_06210 [Candidatus Woesebacteria bacterium RIFCSPLOWO2_01_FULL_39_10]
MERSKFALASLSLWRSGSADFRSEGAWTKIPRAISTRSFNKLSRRAPKVGFSWFLKKLQI